MTLSGGNGDDSLLAGHGNDILYGGSGNDVLNGHTGDDRLDGYGTSGIEYDTLTGGAGSDTFVLGGSWGVSYLGEGHATVIDWDFTADYVELVGDVSEYSLSTGDFGIGSSATDTGLYHQGDLIAVFQDATNINFSRDFRFIGHEAQYGSDGNDTIYGYGGNSFIYGGDGDDYIDSGSPTEYYDQDAVLSGGQGRDRLIAGNGNDVLYGGTEDDELYGHNGDDKLFGYGNGAGVSNIEYDTLTGGAGSDTFVLGGSWGVSYLGEGHATITDWNYDEDFVQLLGDASQYALGMSDFGVGSSAADIGLYHQGDLIAVFQDAHSMDLSNKVHYVQPSDYVW